ncbi:MAG: ribosome silencing factor [Deltaproteobacteria bacterium]|nr:ribosome silencing factor [Deltaproteobacteria bacterium]MBW2018741.1 ribosome silencing factor [Deltaproteobacteria bacterium]MBW2073470.1 ribosome silencing factor [Deltaproteobacteria bacterium]RLB83024.1 MAG: ribosome silencing factor [Deltaproteobacteria bacterium]
MTQPYELTLDPYVDAVLAMKAFDVTVLDVRGLASFADAFIICSGRSHRQVSAIAEFIEHRLKKQGIKPLGVEGLREGHWVLMDYGDVVIHVFYEPIRTFYDLEGLWSDAKRIQPSELKCLK